MSKFIKTLIIGYLFALIVESINMGIGHGEWIGMIFTVLLFYGAFIVLGYLFQDRINESKSLHLIVFGIIGLLLEWFVFNKAPWNGGAVPVIILTQIGMFSHWSTVTFAPRLLLDEEYSSNEKKSFIIFYIIALTIVFVLGFSSSTDARWTIMILGNLVVYVILLRWYIRYSIKK